jgi:toxin HigB-1
MVRRYLHPPPNRRLLLSGRERLSRREVSLKNDCGGFGTPRSRSPMHQRDSASCALITDGVIIHAVIRSFVDGGTEDVFHGLSTRRARPACPQVLWPVARRKLDQINRVRAVEDLRVPPGNRLKRLRGDRSGQYSIRINDQYRVCFRWEDGYADEVEIMGYH